MIDKAQDQAINAMGLYGTDLDVPENYELLQNISKLGQELEADSGFKDSFINNLPTIDSSTLIGGSTILATIGGAAVLLYYCNGNWMKVVPAAGGLYNNGVKSLDKINIFNFTIKSKHLDTLGNTSGWSKFNVETVEEASSIVNTIIDNARSNNSLILKVAENPVGSQGQKSFQVLIDAGRVIGTKGERAIRIVYDELGNIWTVFPEKM